MAFALKCVECLLVKDGQAFPGPAGKKRICAQCAAILKRGGKIVRRTYGVPELELPELAFGTDLRLQANVARAGGLEPERARKPEVDPDERFESGVMFL